MTMQNNIDIFRRNFRRNVHQPKFQTLARQINDQRPILVPITIPADNGQWRFDRFKIQCDCWLANVAKMPNLIRACREIENRLRQLVMRIGEHEYLHQSECRTTDTTGTKIAISQFRRDLCGLCARS